MPFSEAIEPEYIMKLDNIKEEINNLAYLGAMKRQCPDKQYVVVDSLDFMDPYVHGRSDGVFLDKDGMVCEILNSYKMIDSDDSCWLCEIRVMK